MKYPQQLLATIWEHIRIYHWIPLATLNTQIIQCALQFDKHGGGELYEYEYTGNYCRIPR